MRRATQKRHYYSSTHNRLPHIIVHAGKCYKALIDSGATISLLRYSTYNKIEDCYKTPIQPTTAKLNMADGSLMSAIGTMA